FGADPGVDRAVLHDAVGIVRIVGGEIAGLLDAATEELDAGGKIVGYRTGLNVAGDDRFGLRVDAELAWVAVVVDVVAAIGREEIRGRRAAVGITERLVVAAVSVDNVIVDGRAAEAGGGER